jgi:hypothetical protein
MISLAGGGPLGERTQTKKKKKEKEKKHALLFSVGVDGHDNVHHRLPLVIGYWLRRVRVFCAGFIL